MSNRRRLILEEPQNKNPLPMRGYAPASPGRTDPNQRSR